MNSNNTTNTKRKYRILDPEEQDEIMIGLSNEESIGSVTNRLKGHPSVISREIKGSPFGAALNYQE